jgi:hypothetical protein
VCQKKPGPRCAGHVGKQRDKAIADLIAVDRQISRSLRESPTTDIGSLQRQKWDLQAQVARLNDEYDETPTGRAFIAENMRGLSPSEIRESGLGVRLQAATDRYDRKIAALRAAEQGDTLGAAVALNYGAHAGWLTHADVELSSTGRLPSGSFYREGTLLSVDNRRVETVGYAERERSVLVADLIAEHPIEPGPHPNTYVISTSHTDPVLVTVNASDEVVSMRTFDPDDSTGGYGPEMMPAFAKAMDYTDLGDYADDDATESWHEAPYVRRDAQGRALTIQAAGEIVYAGN